MTPVYFQEQITRSNTVTVRCQANLSDATLKIFEWDSFQLSDRGTRQKRANVQSQDKTHIATFKVSGSSRGFTSVEQVEDADDRRAELEPHEIPGTSYPATRLLRPLSGTLLSIAFHGAESVQVWVPLQAFADDVDGLWAGHTPLIDSRIKRGAALAQSPLNPKTLPGATELELGLELDGETNPALCDVYLPPKVAREWLDPSRVPALEKDLAELLPELEFHEQEALLETIHALKTKPLTRLLCQPADRTELIAQVIAHLKSPEASIQALGSTYCNPCGMQFLLIKRNPERYLELVRGLFVEDAPMLSSDFEVANRQAQQSQIDLWRSLLEGRDGKADEARDVVTRVVQASIWSAASFMELCYPPDAAWHFLSWFGVDGSPLGTDGGVRGRETVALLTKVLGEDVEAVDDWDNAVDFAWWLQERKERDTTWNHVQGILACGAHVNVLNGHRISATGERLLETLDPKPKKASRIGTEGQNTFVCLYVRAEVWNEWTAACAEWRESKKAVLENSRLQSEREALYKKTRADRGGARVDSGWSTKFAIAGSKNSVAYEAALEAKKAWQLELDALNTEWKAAIDSGSLGDIPGFRAQIEELTKRPFPALD